MSLLSSEYTCLSIGMSKPRASFVFVSFLVFINCTWRLPHCGVRSPPPSALHTLLLFYIISPSPSLFALPYASAIWPFFWLLLEFPHGVFPRRFPLFFAAAAAVQQWVNVNPHTHAHCIALHCSLGLRCAVSVQLDYASGCCAAPVPVPLCTLPSSHAATSVCFLLFIHDPAPIADE